MPTPAIAVLTFKSRENILEVGGTQSWALNPKNAKQYQYVVCVRNANTRTAQGPEEHGSAFMVGLIKDVVASTDKADRFLITFSKYADLSASGAWKGWRNPVRYTTLEELGVDVSDLDFQPMIETSHPFAEAPARAVPMTIADAKAGLASAFGVSPDAIEITIRG